MYFEQPLHNYFGFLRNKNIGTLYLTVSLLSFGDGLISVFVPVYLWQSGFALWQILFFYFLYSLYSSLLAVLLIPFLRYTGDKLLIFLSIPPLILYYLGLDLLTGANFLFWILPALLALRHLLFNLGYNLGFATSADEAAVGKESGISVLVQSASPMAAPILGGFLISAFGFGNSFLVGSAILVLALFPLLVIPNKKVSKNLRFRDMLNYLKNPEIKKFNLSEVALAIDPLTETVVWALFMFLLLGTIRDLGTVLSVGLLAAAVVSYLVGVAVDRGYQKQTMRISTWGVALMWFLRPFFLAIPLVAGNHVLRKTFRSSMLTAWSAEFYDIARHVRHLSLFLLSKEFFINLVGAFYSGILVLAALFFDNIGVMQFSFIAAGMFTLFALYANRQKQAKLIAS